MTSKKVTLSKNALQVAESRYFHEGENWETCIERVAISVADVETDKNLYKEKFFDMLYHMDFIPGGRIIRNAGKSKGSMLNCYVCPIEDSVEGIGQFLKDSLILWAEGGGVGVDFSPLRPKGTPILGKGGESSGLVSFLEAADAVSKTIESGGARRAAALCGVSIDHPEVIDFINAKLVDGRLSHFNISVLINDDFIKAVEKNEDWTFTFKKKKYQSMPARELWNMIVENACSSGEPGILNATNLYKNNSYYFEPIVATNPCGEVPLENYGSCCLGSLVLPNFITGNTNTNWQKLERTIKLAVRFLDNVIDVNKYTLKEIDAKAHNSRRVGLGIMGLADYLFAKELRYGSKEALKEIEELMKTIRDIAYETSVELAIEKGAFPKFDSVNYCNASFIRKLPTKIRMAIKTNGIRNCCLLTAPPTGSTALLPEISGGIEPLMFKSYKRKDRIGERIYIHPKYKELLLSGNSIPDWFVDTSDLSPKDHLETQIIIQKYIDASVSKTINCPSGTTSEMIKDLLLESIKNLKGVTIYVDGSKYGQVYNNLTEEEALEYLAMESVSTTLSLDDVECSCSKKKDEEEVEICEIPIAQEGAV